ncbi:MAG TPA: putative porin, partial [Gemmatimonadaceae bacterium]
RGQDVRDTVAELAARAHEISLEAGSKMSGALRDVIGAAAGITAFAIESARDLVQYMVRRGQMTQEEADKLIREAEEANAKRPKATPRAEAQTRAAPKAPVKARAAPKPKPPVTARKPAAKKNVAKKPTQKK